MAASVVAAIILVVSCVGIDGFIAGYNYNVYASGTQKTMDVAYLSRLGKSSVPYLVKLLDDKDDKVASQAACALVEQYALYGENESASEAAAYAYGYYNYNATVEVDLPENTELLDGEEQQTTEEPLDDYSKDIVYPALTGELKPGAQGCKDRRVDIARSVAHLLKLRIEIVLHRRTVGNCAPELVRREAYSR